MTTNKFCIVSSTRIFYSLGHVCLEYSSRINDSRCMYIEANKVMQATDIVKEYKYTYTN